MTHSVSRTWISWRLMRWHRLSTALGLLRAHRPRVCSRLRTWSLKVCIWHPTFVARRLALLHDTLELVLE